MVATSSSSSSSSSCASFTSLDDMTKSKSGCTVKFLCSYGGRILPRYPDGRLRYVGGETRILSLLRSLSFSEIQMKLRELCGWETVNLRCQLPTEDLDALVSITSDEDLANLMEEYDLASRDRQCALKIRAFLHPTLTKSPMERASFWHHKQTVVERCVRQSASPVMYPAGHARSGGDLRFRGYPAAARYPLVHHGNHWQ